MQQQQLPSTKDLFSHTIKVIPVFGGVANRWSIVVGQDCNQENKSKVSSWLRRTLHSCTTVVFINSRGFYLLLSWLFWLFKVSSQWCVFCTNMQINFTCKIGFLSWVTWDFLCWPTGGALNFKNNPLVVLTHIPSPQVIAQFWGHIWGVRTSLRVPCPPCWPASWFTGPSPASGTLTHNWRVRQTHAH